MSWLLSKRKSDLVGAAPGMGPLVGQVFLDVRLRQLHCLNPTARQLHKEGVPFLSADLARSRLRHPDERPVEPGELPLVRSWQDERPVEMAFVLPRAGGEWRVSWHTAPVRDGRGRLAGILGTVICAPPEPDWNEMAGLAHDLRSPLHSITLQVEVVDRQLPGDSPFRGLFASLRSSAERALRVGMDLLEWCRGPASRGRPTEAAWFVLEPFLEGLAREHLPAAQKKGLTLATDLRAARGWEVHIDNVRLGRLLSNLLVNAVRYTPHGRVEFTAAWQQYEDQRVLALGVVDTGVGLAHEEQDSIFDPFTQGRAAKEGDSGGSGLGLAVVDRLVKELGLELEVYSEHGRGSMFHLLVPVRLLRQEGHG